MFLVIVFISFVKTHNISSLMVLNISFSQVDRIQGLRRVSKQLPEANNKTKAVTSVVVQL